LAAPDFSKLTFKEKASPEFGLNFAIQLENWHVSQFSSGLTNNRWTMLQNYRFFTGDQEAIRSSRPVDPIANNDPQTSPSADWENLQILPGIMDAINAKLNEVKVEPRVTMIDSMAMDARDEFRAKLEILLSAQQQKKELEPLLQQYGISKEQVPTNDMELEMLVQTMPQFQEEMYLEMALQDIDHQNRTEMLFKQLDTDFQANNIAGVYINRVNGTRQFHRYDVCNAGSSPSMYEDGHDKVWWYNIRMVPIDVIKYEAQAFLSKDELDEIKGGYFQLANNIMFTWGGNNNSNTAFYYDTFTEYGLVMDFQFISTDTFYENIKADGRAFYGYTPKKVGEHGDVEVNTLEIQNLFGGSLIVSQNKVYNYGVKPGVRQPITTNPEDAGKVQAWKVYGDFVVYEANKVNGVSNKSIIRRAIPHITSIDSTWKKYKNAVKKFIPWIVQLDDNVLAKLVLKEGGSAITQQTIVTTLYEEYMVLTDSGVLKEMFNTSMADLIKIIENPGASSLQTLWTNFINEVNFLRDTIGINQLATGAAPTAEQGKFVSQLQAQGTENILWGIMFAKMQLKQNLWENLMFDVMENGARGVMGNKKYVWPKGNPQERFCNLVVEPYPTAAEDADFQDILHEAVAAKTLSADTVAFLKTIRNMKQRWMWLSIEIKRGEARKQAAGIENIKATGEEQRASNQQTHDNEIIAQNEKAKADAKKLILVEAAKAMFEPPQMLSGPDGKKIEQPKAEVDMAQIAELMLLADSI